VKNDPPRWTAHRLAAWLALLLTGLFAAPSNARANAVIDLGGRWERWIGGRPYDTVDVPS
jgi:hypothetical protein